MVEMFGLSSPVPTTISTRPSHISAAPRIGTAMQMWPSMMTEPPASTARRAPRIRSATQPPGSASRYTRAPYTPTTAVAVALGRPMPPLAAVAMRKKYKMARSP